MKDLSSLDISNFLPHRAPFLMVDKLLSLDDENVSTSFEIKKDCIFVENNLFSEIGLLECAAQTCSSIVGRSFFEEDDIEGTGTKLIGFISTIKKAIIISCPKVGDTIITKSKLLSRFDHKEYSICTLKCNIYKDKNELISCEINLFIQELN